MSEERKHTPEPWSHAPETPWICGPDGLRIAETLLTREDSDDDFEAEANARRIVAAVNATREIPVEALESGAVAEAFRLLWEFHAHIDREVHGAKLREIDSRLSTLLSRLPTSEVATTKEPVSGHVPLVPECRHKFVDSKHCLKCGWMPTSEVER